MAADFASGIPFIGNELPGKVHKACANIFLDASVAAIQIEQASSRRCDGDQVAAVHERIFCVWTCRGPRLMERTRMFSSRDSHAGIDGVKYSKMSTTT